MDVLDLPDSSDFFFFLQYIVLRKWNLGVRHYFLFYFSPIQIISMLCLLSHKFFPQGFERF